MHVCMAAAYYGTNILKMNREGGREEGRSSTLCTSIGLVDIQLL